MLDARNSYAALNVVKTKELVIKFKYNIKKELVILLCIKDKIVKIVDCYKYLGLAID